MVAKPKILLYNVSMRKKKAKDELVFGITSGDQPSQSPESLEAQQIKQQYLEIMFFQAKQRNNLLGEFDADGNYKLSNEKLINGLLLAPKKFEEKVDETAYVSATLNEFVLNFKIEFEISEGYSKAQLFLIEVEHRADEDVKHTTKLDELVAVYSAQFREEVYKKWRVYFEENIYEMSDDIYKYLHMQEEEMLFSRELTEILAQLYLTKMLTLLDNFGELGQKIKYEYKQLLEKQLEKDPNLNQNYTKLKFLLDRVMIKNHAFDELCKNKDARLVMTSFLTPLKRVKDKAPPDLTKLAKKKAQEKTSNKAPEKAEKKEAKAKPKKAAKASVKSSAKKAKPAGGKKDKEKKSGGGGGGAFVFVEQPKVEASTSKTQPKENLKPFHFDEFKLDKKEPEVKTGFSEANDGKVLNNGFGGFVSESGQGRIVDKEREM